jgi:hypothetical protein
VYTVAWRVMGEWSLLAGVRCIRCTTRPPGCGRHEDERHGAACAQHFRRAGTELLGLRAELLASQFAENDLQPTSRFLRCRQRPLLLLLLGLCLQAQFHLLELALHLRQHLLVFPQVSLTAEALLHNFTGSHTQPPPRRRLIIHTLRDNFHFFSRGIFRQFNHALFYRFW